MNSPLRCDDRWRIRPGMMRFLILLLPLLLMACDSEKMQETETGLQQNLFIQSLHLVERAGKILRKADLKDSDVEAALEKMDQGLAQAFQVERDFLKRLDLRLPRFYESRFIAGVEQYRLGVEAGNRQQQIEGLNLLSEWGDFWLQEKSTIMLELEQLNG